MTIKYYTAEHAPVADVVAADGKQWPAQRLIEADNAELLEQLGIAYRHEWIGTPTTRGEWTDWQQTTDARGTLYVRNAIIRTTAPGPAPLGYTNWTTEDGITYTREPAGTAAEILDALKERKRAELYQQRVAAEKSSFQHTDGHWYDGGDDSIERFGVVAQQITWALMAGTDPTTVVITGGWRDLNDVGGPSTIAEVQALLQSHYAHGVLCEQNSQTLKAAIAAAANITELDAIDLTAGWPAQSV